MDFTNTSTFEQAPVGIHPAKLIRIVDIGTQTGEYKGEKTVRRQSLFTWELPEELRDDGQPFIISKFYTQSLGDKANLTKDLTSWLGKRPVEPKTAEENENLVNNVIKPLLGKGCQLVITENEATGKRQVATVAGLGKGDKLPDGTHNPLVYFSLDEFDEDVYDNLPNGIQNIIAKSPEYGKAINGDVDEPAPEDEEIPF